MPAFVLGSPVCHAQGGTEKDSAHRAKARFYACTFVRFARSPFTQPTTPHARRRLSAVRALLSVVGYTRQCSRGSIAAVRSQHGNSVRDVDRKSHPSDEGWPGGISTGSPTTTILEPKNKRQTPREVECKATSLLRGAAELSHRREQCRGRGVQPEAGQHREVPGVGRRLFRRLAGDDRRCATIGGAASIGGPASARVAGAASAGLPA